ncbi:DUF6263 family protein [Nocardioides sp. C4-1]|uniref:DUF6263 family protein n=1 Tax=Nocardioides sp. C4-1 TaxID=3151851 RepID=UPI003262D68E
MSRSLATATAVAVVCLPLLAACGDDGPEAGDKPVIEVTETGAEPRSSFAYDVEVGHTETTTMVLDQRIDAGQVADSPPIEFVLSTEVTEVTDDEITAVTTYTDARVTDDDDPTAAQVESAIEPMVGYRTTTTFSRLGELVDSESEIPAGVTGQAREMLEQLGSQSESLTVAYPDEDLGVGATWTATNVLELNGIEVEQTARYELVSFEGEEYEISVEVTQEYRPGDADGFEVTSGDGRTTGTISGTTGSLFPASSESRGSTSVDVEAGGQSQTVTTDTEVSVTTEVG